MIGLPQADGRNIISTLQFLNRKFFRRNFGPMRARCWKTNLNSSPQWLGAAMTTDIPLNEVTTLDDLLGGEWVHTENDPPYWKPKCREARDVIRKRIFISLSNQTCCKEESHDNILADIYFRLTAFWKKDASSFLRSEHRAAWLSQFTGWVVADYFRRRITVSSHDRRVVEKLQSGVVPKETPKERTARRKREHKSLHYDLCQFEKGRGHGPDSMTPASDGWIPTWLAKPSGNLDSLGLTAPDMRVIVCGDEDSRLSAIREALQELPESDREFVLDYVDTRYRVRHTDSERQRFAVLKNNLRARLTN